jgi:DNA-binding transcriptional MerR regulator/effector-binding domain-containing protein
MMLKIGEFAALTQVSIRMLRHYDELGLLKPTHVDWESGYRYYSLDQLPRLNRILALKDLGLSLGEVRLLLDDALSADEIRGILKLKQAQLRQHITEEQARLRRVENRLRYIDQEGQLPEAEIVIKQQAALHVISLSGAKWAGSLFQEAWMALKEHELTPSVRGALALYHGSMAYQRKGVRLREDWLVEAAYMVDEAVEANIQLPDKREMTVSHIPAYAQAASLISTKPDQERYLDALALWQWMAQHQYRLVAPTREIYLKRPRPPGTTDFLTEIVFPIEPIVQENS